MRRALERNAGTRLDSIGVDGWGVDYALSASGICSRTYHYRDNRCGGVMDASSSVSATGLCGHRHSVPADQHDLSALCSRHGGPRGRRTRARSIRISGTTGSPASWRPNTP
jgi:hypothetical protein